MNECEYSVYSVTNDRPVPWMYWSVENSDQQNIQANTGPYLVLTSLVWGMFLGKCLDVCDLPLRIDTMYPPSHEQSADYSLVFVLNPFR